MISKKDIPYHRCSIYLEAVFVVQILETCISLATISDLIYKIKSMTPSLSVYGLKKNLFYLIDYNLIIYHGQNQAFVITGKGSYLLYMIKKKKRTSKKNIKDIMITLE
jgi:hypothetical protein